MTFFSNPICHRSKILRCTVERVRLQLTDHVEIFPATQLQESQLHLFPGKLSFKTLSTRVMRSDHYNTIAPSPLPAQTRTQLCRLRNKQRYRRAPHEINKRWYPAYSKYAHLQCTVSSSIQQSYYFIKLLKPRSAHRTAQHE